MWNLKSARGQDVRIYGFPLKVRGSLQTGIGDQRTGDNRQLAGTVISRRVRVARDARRSTHWTRASACPTLVTMRWRRFWPYAVLLAEVLAFYRRVLFVPGYVIPWDLRYYHFPIAAFAARCLREGALPLWDPYAYCGLPLYANLSAQFFYPPTLIAILLSNWLAPDHLLYFLEVQLIGHVLLAGVGAYWLLRQLDLNPVAAVTGATIFQLGAFFASQTQHLGAIDAAAWLPLALLAVLHLSRTLSLPWTGVIAISLAMSILAGFPAVTMPVFAGTALLALLLIAFRRASLKLALGALAAAVWAALLAAVQILPTAELTGRSVARYRSDFLGVGGGMPLQSLVSLVLPNHYSVFDLRHYSQPWNVTILYTYCGLIGLALAMAGALRKSRWSLIFLLVTLCGAFGMLGASTPVGKALFLMLPRVAEAALYPEFALALFTLGMAVLAGLGADKCGTGVLGCALLAGAALDLIAVSSNRPMNTASVKVEPGISHEQFDGNSEVLDRLRAMVDQPTPPWRIDTVDDSLNWASAAAMFEIPDANGNDPFALERYMQVRLSFVAGGTRWGRYYQVANPQSPVLDLLNVRYLLSQKPVAGLPKIAELPGRMVYERPNALPRFFLVNRIERAPDMDHGLAVLRSSLFRPGEFAVVEDAPPFENQDQAAEPAPVRVVEYTPHEVSLEVDAPRGAYLVTSEAYYPGWRAYVDDREQPLYITNVAFRGLPVPAGRHRIRMRFEPRVLWYGVCISFVALLALLRAAGSAIMKIPRSWIS